MEMFTFASYISPRFPIIIAIVVRTRGNFFFRLPWNTENPTRKNIARPNNLLHLQYKTPIYIYFFFLLYCTYIQYSVNSNKAVTGN